MSALLTRGCVNFLKRQAGVRHWCAPGAKFLAVWLCTGWVVAQPLPDPVSTPAPAAEVEQRITQFLSVYRLGPGDVLTVRVFGEPDLSISGARLTDSGTIFLPTLGELIVGGLTLGQIEQRVVERLRGRILVNPKVSVSVDQYRPFFMNGMVRSPGAYPYQPGLTVRKASSLAGGLQERASLKKIFVIRASDPQQQSQRLEFDDIIYPGDIVTVEESFF